MKPMRIRFPQNGFNMRGNRKKSVVWFSSAASQQVFKYVCVLTSVALFYCNDDIIAFKFTGAATLCHTKAAF